jgi:hypothetical protein
MVRALCINEAPVAEGVRMVRQISSSCLAIASALFLTAAQNATAQPTPPDARWVAWFGCWTADTTSSPTGALRCVVPVAGSRAVDELTIARGKIVARNRLDATGRPHPIDGQGCQGTETANWSTTGRRLYLHADYACGGTPGTSTTLFAFAPSGEWLRVEQVRSGNGSIVSLERLRPADLPSAVPSAAANAIDQQQRAIITARAAASAAITTDEIVDAVKNANADVARSWVTAAGQQFDLTGDQYLALANAGVPAPVLQAISAAGRPVQQVVAAESPEPVQEPQPQLTTMRRCPPTGCYEENRYSDYNGYNHPTPVVYPVYVPYSYWYPAPVIVRRDGRDDRRDFGRAGGRDFGRDVGQRRREPPPPATRGPVGVRPRGEYQPKTPVHGATKTVPTRKR